MGHHAQVSPLRLMKIASAEYISSHKGKISGTIFTKQIPCLRLTLSVKTLPLREHTAHSATSVKQMR